jgi:hypothetical protein
MPAFAVAVRHVIQDVYENRDVQRAPRPASPDPDGPAQYEQFGDFP